MDCVNCGKEMDLEGLDLLHMTHMPLCGKCIDGINDGELPAPDPGLAALSRAFDDAIDLAAL